MSRPDDSWHVKAPDGLVHRVRPGAERALCGSRWTARVEATLEGLCGPCGLLDLEAQGRIRVVRRLPTTLMNS